MQNNKSKSAAVIIAAIVVVLVGIAAATYALIQAASNSREDATTKTTETTSPEAGTSTDPKPRPRVIVFTDKGFGQVTYMFPAGGAITVDNQSSMDMQFSSDDHPTHRNNPQLNMKVLGAGESGTFTPPGKGTYGFHDHINDQFKGTLIIE